MVNIKEEKVCSTKELTKELADDIVSHILSDGNADKAFKNPDTDYDYTNVKKVDAEIDRVIVLVKTVASKGGKQSEVTSDLINVTPVISYVLDGVSWTEYVNSFKEDSQEWLKRA